MSPWSPWLWVGILLAVIAAYFAGRNDGGEIEIATRAREERIAARVQEAAQQGAAAEIGKITVRNTTIRQRVEKEVHEKPVYRDCRHSPDGLRGVNAALAGRAERADRGELPGPDATGGGQLRSDHGEADRGRGDLPPVPGGGAGGAATAAAND